MDVEHVTPIVCAECGSDNIEGFPMSDCIGIVCSNCEAHTDVPYGVYSDEQLDLIIDPVNTLSLRDYYCAYAWG